MKLQDVKNIRQLANILRCQPTAIKNIVDNGYHVTDSSGEMHVADGKIKTYQFKIPKKNKKLGFRTVHSPCYRELAHMLKILNTSLSKIYNPFDNVHGFVKNRNIRTNASAHLNKKIVVSVDIKNFFESIKKDQVKRTLVEYGLNDTVATILSKILTLNGFLPQGFNSSPTIANMVAEKMDNKFIKFCGDSITYTRYADDLYFSSNTISPDISKIIEIIESHGFEVNSNKTQIMKRGQKQYVTGLTVFDNYNPRISKKVKRNLRLETYYISKFGFQEHALKKLELLKSDLKDYNKKKRVDAEMEETSLRIWGWIHFINSIEPKLGTKLKKQLKKQLPT